MRDNRPVPFKISFWDKTDVRLAKKYLNLCFKLKGYGPGGPHAFDFEDPKTRMNISKTIAILLIAKQVDVHHAYGIVNFLSGESTMEERYT